MATCDYCGNKSGLFEGGFHNDCRVEYVEKGMQLIAEGIALKWTKYPAVFFDELSEKEMKELDSDFSSKQRTESWLWLGSETRMYVEEIEQNISMRNQLGLGSLVGGTSGKIEKTTKINKWTCERFAFTDTAIYALASERGRPVPLRWSFSSIAQIYAADSEKTSEHYVIKIISNESIPGQPEQFTLGATPWIGYPIVSSLKNGAESDPFLKTLQRLATSAKDNASLPETGEPATQADSLGDELSKLAKLHDQELLSDEEFQAAKNKLLGL